MSNRKLGDLNQRLHFTCIKERQSRQSRALWGSCHVVILSMQFNALASPILSPPLPSYSCTRKKEGEGKMCLLGAFFKSSPGNFHFHPIGQNHVRWQCLTLREIENIDFQLGINFSYQLEKRGNRYYVLRLSAINNFLIWKNQYCRHPSSSSGVPNQR